MKQIPFHPQKSELPLLLDGRQSALVRPMSPQPEFKENESIKGHWATFFQHWNMDHHLFEFKDIAKYSPFCSANDILWCKERWWSDWKHTDETELCYAHEQAYGEIGVEWLPSITMPKSACRLWLKVLEVKVCRWIDLTVQEINNAGFEAGIGQDQVSLEKLVSEWIWYATVNRIEKP